VTSIVDRPAAIRRALRDLVAERGFHGASMSAVASTAGVATGTSYVHYESKEDLVFATYLEIKQEMADAVMAKIDRDADPGTRFEQIWDGVYAHLAGEPARARFLTQMEESPFYTAAHLVAMERGDALASEASRPDLQELLIDLPAEIQFSLALGPAIRLAASGVSLNQTQLESLKMACWRAVTSA
jgi:AcrR family transcriptional regulator